MSAHVKRNLKAYASLAGAVLTALSAEFTHNAVLPVLVIALTAGSTWLAENDDAA